MNRQWVDKGDKYITSILKEARLSMGISQSELARRLKVSQAYVSRIEDGDIRVIYNYRYLPRVIKWLTMCGVTFQMSFVPMLDADKAEKMAIREKRKAYRDRKKAEKMGEDDILAAKSKKNKDSK